MPDVMIDGEVKPRAFVQQSEQQPTSSTMQSTPTNSSPSAASMEKPDVAISSPPPHSNYTTPSSAPSNEPQILETNLLKPSFNVEENVFVSNLTMDTGTALNPGRKDELRAQMILEMKKQEKEEIAQGDFMTTFGEAVVEHHPLFLLQRWEERRIVNERISDIKEIEKKVVEPLTYKHQEIEKEKAQIEQQVFELSKFRGQLLEMRQNVDVTNPHQVEAYNDMVEVYNTKSEQVAKELEELNRKITEYNQKAEATNAILSKKQEEINVLSPIGWRDAKNKAAYLLGAGVGIGANAAVGILAGGATGALIGQSSRALAVVEKLGQSAKVNKAMIGLFATGEGVKAGYEYMHGVHPVDVALDVAEDVALFVGFGHGFKKTIEPAIYEKKILEWNLKHSQHIVYGERGNAIGSALKAEGAEGAWKQTIYDAKTKSIPGGAMDKQRGFVYEELAPADKGYLAFRGGVKKFMTSAEFKMGDYDPSKPFKYTELPAIRGGGTSRNINPETITQVQEINNLGRSLSGASRSGIISNVKNIPWPDAGLKPPIITPMQGIQGEVKTLNKARGDRMLEIEKEDILNVKQANTQILQQEWEQKQWFKVGKGNILSEFDPNDFKNIPTETTITIEDQGGTHVPLITTTKEDTSTITILTPETTQKLRPETVNTLTTVDILSPQKTKPISPKPPLLFIPRRGGLLGSAAKGFGLGSWKRKLNWKNPFVIPTTKKRKRGSKRKSRRQGGVKRGKKKR